MITVFCLLEYIVNPKRNFLKNELQHKEKECLSVDKFRVNLQQVVCRMSSMSFLDYNHLLHYSDRFSEKKMVSILATHEKKLRK